MTPHQNITVPSSGHHGNTIRKPSGHQETAGIPPGHITETPLRHDRDTTGTHHTTGTPHFMDLGRIDGGCYMSGVAVPLLLEIETAS